MEAISVRQLRNDVSDIVRRVEGGEELTVTVNGRPAIRLVPFADRPGTMPWPVFAELMARAAADRGLLDDLGSVLPETTDDL